MTKHDIVQTLEDYKQHNISLRAATNKIEKLMQQECVNAVDRLKNDIFD